jgi:hypothetical protein
MYLIQIFLPLYNNDGKPFPRDLYVPVRDDLIDRFHGLTAHSRAPVKGLWQESEDHTVRDDLVIYEVMAQDLDREWWRTCREGLERRFQQEAIVVRAQEIDML